MRRGDRGGRGPAHAEVALDGAGDRGGGHHLAGQAVLGERVVGIGLDDRVHVGGRPADVDDDHVAGTGQPVDAAGQQLDPGEHHVRRRAAHHRGEVGPGREVLAADHVGQEHLADRGAGRVGGEDADLRAPRCRRGRAARLRRPGSRPPRRGRRRCRPPPPGRSSRSRPGRGRRRAAPRRCRRRCRRSAAPRPARSSAPRGSRDPRSGGRLATPMTATTLPPLLSATRRPASAVTSSSLPTTAIRSPPPALEQASTCASVARASRATSAARHASYPSSTSVSIVVRCAAAATMLPEPRSTSAALVKVEPKSTQTTAFDRRSGVTAGPRGPPPAGRR